MKLSRKSRYGLKALIYMALDESEEYIPLNAIAESNGISTQYLEQIFAILRRAGIVKSIKGSQGGYLLKEKPKELTVARIISSIEGTYYLEDEENDGISSVIQHLIICKVNDGLDTILGGITLEDLKENYLMEQSFSIDMYYI
ncbi:MAG: Rrf2 family transcriptional regulator [Clostridium sp.]|nr:Rrf2 family transcriptional regulator [Clostridium sp.]